MEYPFDEQIDIINDYEKLRDIFISEYDYIDSYEIDSDGNLDEDRLRKTIYWGIAYVNEYCSFNDPNEIINIARCLNLHDVKDFKKDSLGIYWTHVNHFYDFAREHLDSHNLYCVTAKTKAENIDWIKTIMLSQEFSDEYELRVMDDDLEHIWDLKLWRVENGKLVDIQKHLLNSKQYQLTEQEILNTLIVNVNGVNGVSRITLNPTINKDMNMNKPSENHTDTTISISESAKYWELCSELAMKFDVPIESIILYENNVYFTTDVYAIIEVYCEKNNRKLKRIFLNLSEDDDTVDLEEFLVIVDEHDGVIPIQTLLG